MSRRLRIFLCHASQDKPVVRSLYHRLLSENWIDPWLDEEKLNFGQHWATAIEDALDTADVVLIFLSKNSVYKESFIQRELNYAWELSLEKPTNVIFLLPLRLDDCETPRFLRTKHCGDYFGEEIDKTYRNLTLSLRERYNQKLQLERNEEVVFNEGIHRREIEIFKHTTLSEISKENPEITSKDVSRVKKAKAVIPSIKIRRLMIFGVIFLGLLAILFGGNVFLKGLSEKGSEASETPTLLSSNVTNTSVQTKTLTPIPPTFTPTLGIGSTIVSQEDGMVLVYVPAGEFIMGSDDMPDEQPIHSVFLDAFWIDQTEVTNAMYERCVAYDACTPIGYKGSQTRISYYDNFEFDNYPIVGVNWEQANAYCLWVGRKLPTEAQWEKAARGASGRIYPWGDTPPTNTLLNYNNHFGDTTEVGSFPEGASIYGALDMAGNVWEWVSSLYRPYPYNLSDGREDLSAKGPRVMRGSSLSENSDAVRSANRVYVGTNTKYGDAGFRCASSP